MKVGLYFGSFNPIHIGHLIIANHIINNAEVDEVWFVVSPQNPLKESISLLNEQHRYSMVKIAIEDEKKLKVSNVEFSMPKPSYTIDTLIYLSEKFKQHQFTLIIGSDSFLNIKKWKNYKQIILNYNILIYPRLSFPVTEELAPNIKIITAPLIEISSTQIRKLIKTNKSIRYLVTEKVLDEIELKGYYKSNLENPS
jgi:nicotinate-nucleotide adenylyltransferase